jgi:Chromo (CHRromatin Organisation MOdifier) domain
MTPFYANYGYNPKVTWLQQAEVKNPAANTYAHWMEEVYQRCKGQLAKTRERMAKYVDPKRLPAPPFDIGDQVMLDSRNLKTKRSSKKLDHKMNGPYTITKLVGSHAVQLRLPKTLRCHNVFHVSLLEPYRASQIEGRQQALPPPVVVDGENEYEVEQILRSEKRKAKRGKKWWVEYLVRWKNYPPGESTWETVDAFDDGAEHLLHEFHQNNPKAPRDPSLP